MTKPLGYFVAVLIEHPDHTLLKFLEPNLPGLNGSQLSLLLSLCALGSNTKYTPGNTRIEYCLSCIRIELELDEKAVTAATLIHQMTPETQLALIPFLHQLIQG